LFTRYLIVVPRPFPAAEVAVRRKYLIVVPRPAPAAPLFCASQVLDRGAQADARGAAQALDRGAQAFACDAAR
jgi:hypothetical protein